MIARVDAMFGPKAPRGAECSVKGMQCSANVRF